MEKVEKSQEQWREELSDEQFLHLPLGRYRTTFYR